MIIVLTGLQVNAQLELTKPSTRANAFFNKIKKNQVSRKSDLTHYKQKFKFSKNLTLGLKVNPP